MLPNSGAILYRRSTWPSPLIHHHLSTSTPSSAGVADIAHRRHYSPPTPMNDDIRQLFKRINRWSFAGQWDSANQCAERYLPPSQTKRDMYDVKRRMVGYDKEWLEASPHRYKLIVWRRIAIAFGITCFFYFLYLQQPEEKIYKYKYRKKHGHHEEIEKPFFFGFI